LRIVLGKEHHCGDAPHARSKLRARRARPCRSRGADERNEVAPLHRLSQGLELCEFNVRLGPSKQEMTVNEIAANRQFALHNPEPPMSRMGRLLAAITASWAEQS
jgi:hypothetical protein